MGELVVAAVKRHHLRSTVFAYPTTEEIITALPYADGYGILAVERRHHGERHLTKCILINSYHNVSYEATYIETPDDSGWSPVMEVRIEEQLKHLQAARNYITFVTVDCSLLTEAICCRIGSFVVTSGVTIPQRDADEVAAQQRRLLNKEISKLTNLSLLSYVKCDGQSDTYISVNDFFRTEAYRFHLACFDRDLYNGITYEVYDKILYSEVLASQ